MTRRDRVTSRKIAEKMDVDRPFVSRMLRKAGVKAYKRIRSLEATIPSGLTWQSSHCAKDTVQLFKERKIQFLPREANPPAVPKLRLIEDFWGALKQAVYQEGWEAKSEDILTC